jgi:hypothetical protein
MSKEVAASPLRKASSGGVWSPYIGPDLVPKALAANH